VKLKGTISLLFPLLLIALTPESKAQTAAVQSSQPIAPFHSTDGKVRVYITDHPVTEGNAAWNGTGNGSAHSQVGDDPRVIEVEADILKVCPAYIVASNNPDRSDLVLIFRRKGGERTMMFAFGGLTGLALSAGMKVDGASLFQSDGDMIYAVKKNTVESTIKDVCKHIQIPVQTSTVSTVPATTTVATAQTQAPIQPQPDIPPTVKYDKKW
jgi:hypothetical protein